MASKQKHVRAGESLKRLVVALILVVVPVNASAQQLALTTMPAAPAAELGAVLARLEIVALKQDITNERIAALDTRVTALARSLEEHRAEARAMRSWVSKHWSKVATALAGIVGGWLMKRLPAK